MSADYERGFEAGTAAMRKVCAEMLVHLQGYYLRAAKQRVLAMSLSPASLPFAEKAPAGLRERLTAPGVYSAGGHGIAQKTPDAGEKP